MSVDNTFKSLGKGFGQTINTVVSVLKILVKSRFTLKLPVAEGEKCIVLSNGPSLKHALENKREALENNPLICVNTFALSEEFTILKPKYYVIIDPVFWETKKPAFVNSLKSLEENTSWKMHLFVPLYCRNQSIFTRLREKNKNIIVTPFNYTVFKGFPSVAHFFYKNNLAMPQALNVTIAALFLGVNLKFKETILVGADHTWHEYLHMSDDNIMHTKVVHFFEEKEQVEYHPFYKGAIPENGTQRAHEFFDIWSRTFWGYELLEKYASSVNRKIYNASKTSFIDAFERLKL